MPSKKYYYMCGTDFDYKRTKTSNPPDMFESVKKLKEARDSCWKYCGIIKVEMKITKWVVEQDLAEELA